ncbi:hypothetical protein [Pedobacter chitinilyticus]|uniref:Periplasmic heavy metal sensor n=1 Tax=Pedobacter chitinilyticus TaxID=2233776 RepID=A0A3S3PPN2_9SPHI|nr:hypothetical protein [Pedobacter chitinilyticus]RWU09931.1 hypothetical protein DPV69_00875 [Pedobacter chitinilyticus]
MQKTHLIIIVIFLISLTSYAQHEAGQKTNIATLLRLTKQQQATFKKIIQEHRDSVLKISKTTSINYLERRELLLKLSLSRTKRIDSLLSPEQRIKLKEYYSAAAKKATPLPQKENK